MKDKHFFLYLIILIPIFVLLVGLWSLVIDGTFYYCSDKVLVLDFFPPFVHKQGFGDFFIASPVIVYFLWAIFLLLIFVLPWIVAKIVIKKKLKTAAVVFVSLAIPVLLFIFWLIYGFATSSSLPPDSPPNWTSPGAIFTIKKEHENYLINYNIDGETGYYYVGNSNVDLAGYIGESVLIKGDFPDTYFDNESNLQCILNVCHKIFVDTAEGTTSVINIDEIIQEVTNNFDTEEKIVKNFDENLSLGSYESIFNTNLEVKIPNNYVLMENRMTASISNAVSSYRDKDSQYPDFYFGVIQTSLTPKQWLVENIFYEGERWSESRGTGREIKVNNISLFSVNTACCAGYEQLYFYPSKSLTGKNIYVVFASYNPFADSLYGTKDWDQGNRSDRNLILDKIVSTVREKSI